MRNTITIITSVLIFSFWGCEEPDTIPPDISIASPVDGAVVSDTVTIKTVVADNDGISNVEFFLDGDLLTTVSEEPFETEWNTTETTNGVHTLQCKAVDNSDNETLSESIQVTVANILFTANFTNDWLCSDCGEGIIFISDMDGNVLAEATWTGNASFEFEAPESLTEFPERISVTTVTNGLLRTNLEIPFGSSWTWGKNYPEPDWNNPIENIFDFQNIPDHSGYVISSLWSAYISTDDSITTPYGFFFYESPMDIYLKLNTAGTDPKYIWLAGVTAGNNSVDLSNLNDTESTTIDLQGSATGFWQYLYGYPNPGSRYTGRYRLDYDGAYDTTVASVSVFYPPSAFSDYRTSTVFYDSEENDYWYQSIYGDIPNTFDKIDADFDFISTTPTNFQISTTSSNFDQIRSGWTQSGDNYYSWYFYGPNDLTDYSFPNLPNTVLQQYPDLNNESFELYSTILMDHSELDSYEDILDIIFNSSNYFYNVVNDFRSRTKYYYSGRSTNILQDYEMEDDYYGRVNHK